MKEKEKNIKINNTSLGPKIDKDLMAFVKRVSF
jgi:hypothetical protein